MFQEKYLDDAVANEAIFRNILMDNGVRNDKKSLLELHQEYSEGDRYGKFTVLNFKVGPYDHPINGKVSEGEALFSSEDVATLSGCGSVRKYKIADDLSVTRNGTLRTWMS